jgi:hypothetical protein
MLDFGFGINCELAKRDFERLLVPEGFALIDAFPNGRTSDSLCFTQAILATLHMKYPSPTTRKQPLIRMGSAAPRRSKVTSDYLKEFNSISGPFFILPFHPT